MQVQQVNILHISDLHYDKNDDHNQKVVYHAFLEDIQQFRSTRLNPDIIIFSGDLVKRGDDYHNFTLVLDKFIQPLLQQTSLDESRLFLVPGNHDVQRSVIQKHEVTQKGMETTLTSRDKLNDFYLNSPNDDFIRQKLGNFIEFKECLGNVNMITSDLFVDTYYVRDLNIGLVCLNTAWMSCGGLSDINDRHRLLVPEGSVRRALEHLPDVRIRILVGHHPVDWLAEYAQEDLRRLLEREFTIYLHGHMHEPLSSNVRSTIGRALLHQSGALYTDRTRYNGYALISISPTDGHAQVTLRSFYEGREKFDAALDVVGGGCWYSSEAAERFFAHLPRSLDATRVTHWVVQRVGPALQQALDEGFSDRPVSEVFVPPRLSKGSARVAPSEAEDPQDAELCPLADLVSGSENYLVIAKPQFGKTTLLRQIALGIIRNSSVQATPTVPCLIEFSEIKPGRDRFLRLLRAQLPDIDGYGFGFQDLVRNGSLVILVDDVDLSDQTRWKALASFIKEYPTNRFVLATNFHVFDQLDISTSIDVPIPITSLRMEPFGRREMRELVERWAFKGSPDRESVLDRLVSDIVHINIPLTPVNGTILLTIFDLHGDFTPINKAVLIETFIETLLEKHSMRNVLRARFDFTNKVRLLSFLAGFMAKADSYRFDYEELIAICRGYLRL